VPKGQAPCSSKCERVKTMGWFRSRMRLGSWSALFALTIQLVLSFGHLHFDGASARSVSAQTVSLRTVLAPLALRWAMQPSATLPPTAPAQHKPAGLADDFCAICSVMRLAGVPTPTPVLPLPIGSRRILLDVAVELTVAASPHLPFQARAPPQA
jgi:hypothetical protein